ncbi:MAG: hypothetical protein M1820_004613 [Bogoriella megaspora]|nr:MAG: hypothetical protein M1820_004613 [Bogoriella megaspora]
MAELACDVVNLNSVHSFLKPQSTPTSSGSTVVSYVHDRGDGPVLWLVHGYPQTAFIFRHLAPLLKDQISLFIPELPGYGISTAVANASGFRAVGGALVEAFEKLFPQREVILAGHDRGARLCHRLAVDNAHPPGGKAPPFRLLGLVLLDIVPTLTQWQAFANPKAAATYFHWPFLASPIAPAMIEAFGGDKWVRLGLSRISGDNKAASERFQSDRAWEVYESNFTKRAAIEGSCADYAAACFDEPASQEEDQANGRKIEVPTLVMWSFDKLGTMHGGLGPIWRPWIKYGVDFRTAGCGDGVGHYLPEEATDQVEKRVKQFLEPLLRSKS